MMLSHCVFLWGGLTAFSTCTIYFTRSFHQFLSLHVHSKSIYINIYARKNQNTSLVKLSSETTVHAATRPYHHESRNQLEKSKT